MQYPYNNAQGTLNVKMFNAHTQTHKLIEVGYNMPKHLLSMLHFDHSTY